jgi:aspartokinase
MENLTLEQLRERNLDVYLFPPNRLDLLAGVIQSANASGLEATEFETEIAHFKLIGVGISKRPGVIAPFMKALKKKTVREFIHAE